MTGAVRQRRTACATAGFIRAMAGSGYAFDMPTDATLCFPRPEMLVQLRSVFGETRKGRGIQRPVSIMEVWSSERTGHWMIVSTGVDGLSCIIAHGEDWSFERENSVILGP
ncbi:MAG: hypothetical protein AAGF74_08260 [Pseudomonadota bacterium]